MPAACKASRRNFDRKSSVHLAGEDSAPTLRAATGELSRGVSNSGQSRCVLLPLEASRFSGCVVGYLEPTIVEIAGQRGPAGSGVADGASEIALAGDFRELLVHPSRQLVDLRPYRSPAYSAPDVRRPSRRTGRRSAALSKQELRLIDLPAAKVLAHGDERNQTIVPQAANSDRLLVGRASAISGFRSLQLTNFNRRTATPGPTAAAFALGVTSACWGAFAAIVRCREGQGHKRHKPAPDHQMRCALHAHQVAWRRLENRGSANAGHRSRCLSTAFDPTASAGATLPDRAFLSPFGLVSVKGDLTS